MVLVSVIVPAHNPDARRLGRVLHALNAQSLDPNRWELLVIDNGSRPPLDPAMFQGLQVVARIVVESEAGLTAARRRGLAEARGACCVFVDDDNVLVSSYLAEAARILDDDPSIGAAGGPVTAEFETEPAPWTTEFFPLLALRDLGRESLTAQLQCSGHRRREYPACAPVGAGMVLRRAAAESWLRAPNGGQLSDRCGATLSSAGDNDIVLTVLGAGWRVGYYPELRLTHLIPAARLSPGYLARLNRGIQQSWMQVLLRHRANPWPPLTPFGATLRKAKAWLTYQPWRSAAHRVRWQGACGHFDGRVRVT